MTFYRANCAFETRCNSDTLQRGVFRLEFCAKACAFRGAGEFLLETAEGGCFET